MDAVSDLVATHVADPFRPSEYTGLLMHALKLRAIEYGRGKGLDMGTGSGALLATMGLLGVQQLYGVDIDPEALVASRDMLDTLDLLDRAHLLQGSLWEPVGEQRFDVIVANLPNFPATRPSDPEHSRFWSMGGADGRQWMDPFLAGLRAHLDDSGVAFITHNSFIGLAETQAMLQRVGLSVHVILGLHAVLHPLKSKLMNPKFREQYQAAGIERLGPYEFAEVLVLEIRPLAAA